VSLEDRHTTVDECYRALADQVEYRLGGLDAYFVRLAEAMRVWLDVWEEVERKTVTGKRIPKSESVP
jgi:reversibly glycosylated polypeptide/UDP-arabinopyranose mutase